MFQIGLSFIHSIFWGNDTALVKNTELDICLGKGIESISRKCLCLVTNKCYGIVELCTDVYQKTLFDIIHNAFGYRNSSAKCKEAPATEFIIWLVTHRY